MAFPGARTGYPGTITALDPITAFNNNKLPAGRLLYVAANATQGTISSTTNVTSINDDCVVGASRVIKVTGKVCQVTKQTGFGNVKLILKIDNVEEAVLMRLEMDDFDTTSTGAGCSLASFEGTYVTTVTAASHNFKLAMSCDSGHIDIDASGDGPENFLLVEDIGSI